MKQNLFNKLWLRVGMIVAIMTTALAGTAWADEASFAPSNFSGQGTSGSGSAISATVDGVTFACNKGYGTTQIRCYSGGKITISSSNTITAISFTFSGTYTGGLETSYTSLSTTSWEKTLSSQARITACTVTYSTGGTPTCATPTFSPAAGAVVSGTKVSISSTEGATIYYTTNGTTPTSNSSVYSAPIEITAETTIKAFASKSDCNDSEVATATYTIKQAVSGYNIDFENDVDAYVDWEMTNIGTSNTAITAHGGSKYGANINDSGNGTATASIQTKEKVAYPNVFTCYVSKVSGNTTASNWVVEVSSNGSDWTEVATQDAKSMEKGEWVEFTADIKAAGHTNVYVRLSYGSSTAIRAVDDISLTTYTPAAIEAPSINVPEEFTISTTATITCVTAGATIYYSYDNTTWTEYTEALTITETKTIYAKAVKGSDESAIVSATTTKVLATPNVIISAASFNVGETATVTTDGPAVTLTTSDTSIASVSGTTVTGVAAGTATITATWTATSDYSGGSAEFVVTVTDPNAPGSVNNPYTVAQALAVIDGLEDGAKTDHEVYVAGTITQIDEVNTTQYYNATYWISNDGGTTKLEVFRGKYVNNANFTSSDQIKVNDQVVVYGKLQKYVKDEVVTPEVAQGNYIYSLQRPAGAPTVTLGTQTNVASVEMWYVDADLVPINSGAEVAEGTEVFVLPTAAEGYTIQSVNVVDADNASVTVTANSGNWSFVMPNKSVTVNIEAVQSGVTPPTGDQYALATSITSGKTYVIANADGTKVMGKTQNNNNRAAVDATLNGTTLTAADACEFTVEVVDNNYTFYDAVNDGYLYAASSSSNQLKTQSTLDDNGKWTIVIDGETGVASVVAQGTNSRNVMQYNNGSTLFACYGSASQTAIKLYEKVEATPADDVEVTIAIGYSTLYYGDRNLVVPADVEAYTYKVTNKLEVSKTYEAGDVIPAGTAVVLKAANGSYTFEATTETGEGDDYNALKGSDEAATTTGGNYYYALSLNSSSDPSSVGFYWMAAGGAAFTCGAHKAYLALDNTFAELASGGVKGFIALPDDDATAISTVESFTEEGAIYNVAGQRISKMQKGINIVNGKKVLK